MKQKTWHKVLPSLDGPQTAQVRKIKFLPDNVEDKPQNWKYLHYLNDGRDPNLQAKYVRTHDPLVEDLINKFCKDRNLTMTKMDDIRGGFIVTHPEDAVKALGGLDGHNIAAHFGTVEITKKGKKK